MKNKLLEKKRWNGHNKNDVIKLYNNHISKLDCLPISELDKKIGRLLNIPVSYAKNIRFSDTTWSKITKASKNIKYKHEKYLIKNAYNYTFPNSYYGPYRLKCKCGNIQTYTVKSSLLRVLGYEHSAYNTTKDENKGVCGKCSRSAVRVGWTLSKQNSNTRRLNAYNYSHKTNYTSVDQLPNPNKFRVYSNICRTISQTSLKRERPNEYELYQKNKYDGSNLNQLSIDHIKPLHECFKEGWSVRRASDISNLQVLTMRENILKENPKTIFNDGQI